ncbi:MAG: amidohydrolase [Roseiflexaceae bacterium]|jgi:hippurate hydrolase
MTDYHPQMIAWRHALHQIPETDFNEVATAAYVAAVVTELGYAVHTGIGGTGVVASLTRGTSTRSIGFRAELDGLLITEAVARPYASRTPGRMHACGHDGHMAMLLGAAALLAADHSWSGTVRFVFQPDEEHGHGAQAMIADDVLTRFPVDCIYGIHNMPGMPAGNFATRVGGIMASEDNFVIDITGIGGHAARPHMTVDPLVIGAQIVLALQTIVARSIDPSDAAVVSCTEFITDGIRNAIPTHVTIKGDTRSYAPHVQATLEQRMRELCAGICAAHGATCVVSYTHEFSPTVNPAAGVAAAVHAAQAVVGADRVDANTAPLLGSEDFGAFLATVPGNFIFIGNGDTGQYATPLHNASYDFNDAILPIGASYLVQLAKNYLQ